MNPKRVFWCIVYLIFGFALLFLFCNSQFPELRRLLTENLSTMLWCFGWSSVGIALGLWNDRKNTTPRVSNHAHYVTYFIFVLFVAALAAFIAFSANDGLKAYAASALTAIVIGFVGDGLAGVILKLAKIE